MTACRWTEDGYKNPDGSACETPRREHCHGRKTCANHLGWGEQVCARCVGRTRQDIRRIVELAALMPDEAENAGVDSEAASLAGPTADPEAWMRHQALRRRRIMERFDL